MVAKYCFGKAGSNGGFEDLHSSAGSVELNPLNIFIIIHINHTLRGSN